MVCLLGWRPPNAARPPHEPPPESVSSSAPQRMVRWWADATTGGGRFRYQPGKSALLAIADSVVTVFPTAFHLQFHILAMISGLLVALAWCLGA